MYAELTQHAQARMQQRGIPAEVVEQLIDFGRVTHDHQGGRIAWFDRASRLRLQRECAGTFYRAVEKHLDAYVILDRQGRVVTVGHRFRRIRQH